MEVEDVMVQKVVTIEADSTVRAAAKLMNQHEIGCLIATESGRIAGIITERDILKKIVEESRDPASIKVHETMSEKLVMGTPSMEITDATRLMLKNEVKKLPIVVEGKLVGILTLTDIVRVARTEPEMVNLINQLKQGGWLPPKRMQKVVDYYIT